MKNLTTFTILFILVSIQIQAQQLDWSRSLGSSSTPKAASVREDVDRNVYIASQISGNVDVDPGPDTIFTHSFNNGLLVEKLDPQGNYVWHFYISQSLVQIAPLCMQFTDDSHFLLVGYSSGKIDLDPGPDSTFFDGSGLFIAKYDTSASLMWMKSIQNAGMSGPEMNTYFNLDQAGNIYLIGNGYTSSDFDPDTPVVSLTHNGVFFAKYDSTGQFIFVKGLPGYANIYGIDILCDKADNIYVCGSFDDQMDIDPSPDTVPLVAAGSNGYNDIFIAKYTPTGDLNWDFSIGNVALDDNNMFALDDSANIYLTGNYTAGSLTQVDFDPGPATHSLTSVGYDIFIAKYDSSRNYQWVRKISGTGDQRFKSMRRSANGNIYMTGEYMNTTDFDPGTGNTNTQANQNSRDVFTAVYDNNGNYMNSMHIGSPNADYVWDMELTNSFGFYLLGVYQDTLDCDPDTTISNLIGDQNNNIFIAKYSWPVLSMNENVEVNEIKCYPSPASDFLNIELPDGINAREISIYNMTGQKLISSNCRLPKTTLNVGNFNPGIYLLRVEGAGKQFVKRFTVVASK
jgi:hypothetical protein